MNYVDNNIKKHNVLLFGQKIFGKHKDKIMDMETSIIHYIDFPNQLINLERLTKYSLVILDYSAFSYTKGVYENEQDKFCKFMTKALDEGTTFVFVHYNEEVPGIDKKNYILGEMDFDDIKELWFKQIGFRCLYGWDIRPLKQPNKIDSARHYRSEFQLFLESWGVTYNKFSLYGDNEYDEKIYGTEKSALAFSIKIKRGLSIYIPFQRNYSRPSDLIEGIHGLIDSCLMYIATIKFDLPNMNWITFFRKRKKRN